MVRIHRCCIVSSMRMSNWDEECLPDMFDKSHGQVAAIIASWQNTWLYPRDTVRSRRRRVHERCARRPSRVLACCLVLAWVRAAEAWARACGVSVAGGLRLNKLIRRCLGKSASQCHLQWSSSCANVSELDRSIES